MSSSREKLASPDHLEGYGATGCSTVPLEATSDYVFTKIHQEEGKDLSKTAPSFGTPRIDHPQPGGQMYTGEPGYPFQETGSDANATTSLVLDDRGQPLTDRRNGQNQNLPFYKRYYLLHVLVSGAAILFVALTLLLAIAEVTKSESPQPVLPGDAVLLSSITGFLFDRISIWQVKPSENESPAEAEISYSEDCNSKESVNRSTFDAPLHRFSYPQGILVQNSTQIYLLPDSEISFYFTVTNLSSPLAESIKVCQFSNLADYNALIQATSNKDIEGAENNGVCLPILRPPNTFKIHSPSYYYYAVSILTGTQVYARYTYNLTQRFYNRTMLSAYDCSVVDTDCVITGVIHQTSTKCVVVYIPPSESVEPTKPYMFYLKESEAYGIAILVWIPTGVVYVSVVYLCLSVILCVITRCGLMRIWRQW